MINPERPTRLDCLNIDDLRDARAYHEKQYVEESSCRPGSSRIAAGQHRRYADAIAAAAIILGQMKDDERS